MSPDQDDETSAYDALVEADRKYGDGDPGLTGFARVLDRQGSPEAAVEAIFGPEGGQDG